ncbi:hypothetical protein LTR56_007148 [Elasticomyces elasticus]|nr:hypothetical protein LTR22_020431 [Elasticomyces elasticus]KAK3649016.1 hypothetical protein LTR56_007148 [Elasticomyces elasticus]KAK4917784.1 hypothetical protein LTR49_014321 [Elasticomyces elasticus]KAK5740454.1 hypothetical protein LTS12_024942 [Elasticomyces elasticus]
MSSKQTRVFYGSEDAVDTPYTINMGDQVQAKICDMSNTKLPPPPQQNFASPSKTNYHYLSEMEASRPSAEKVRFDMLKRVNDYRDKVKMIEGLKRFGAEFKLSTPVPGDLVEVMAGREGKRDEILGMGRGDGGERKVGGLKMVEVQEKEMKVNHGLGIGDGYTDGWLRVL